VTVTAFLEQVLNLVEDPAGSSLHPGGWLVLGRYAAPADPLAAAIADLRTVRSGGSAIGEAEAITLLEGAGPGEHSRRAERLAVSGPVRGRTA
jgi:hypothetical protein